jgi:hypothetical protein
MAQRSLNHFPHLNDITVGSNGFYRAAVGPDPCSEIGSPIAAGIAALFDVSA